MDFEHYQLDKYFIISDLRVSTFYYADIGSIPQTCLASKAKKTEARMLKIRVTRFEVEHISSLSWAATL